MIEYVKIWLELKTDKRAVTALEYGLIAAAIIAVCAGTFFAIGAKLENVLTNVSTALGA